MSEILRPLPIAELHVHLRGAMPESFLKRQLSHISPQQIFDFVPERHREIFTAAGHLAHLSEEDDPELVSQKLFDFSGFDDFLATYLFTAYLVRDIESFESLVSHTLESFHRSGLRYVEVTVNPIEYTMQGIPLEDLIAVLKKGALEAALEVRWIIDLVRNVGPVRAEEMLHQMIPLLPDSICGITLGGSEHLFPPAQFKSLYELAREHGLHLTVHAGEALGAESVRDAIELLGVERIGHGIRAIEDPDVITMLRERQIPLEVCVSGNIATGIVESLELHPVRRLFDAGVPITINTDDPSFFGTSLMREYDLLRQIGFNETELSDIADNAIRFAFLSEKKKEMFLRRAA